MEEAEQSEYVAQLRAEFAACDSTGSGFLDRDDLTKLCGQLHLDAHLRPLLDTLLPDPNARVNFEEFKDGFVFVLSRTLDLSSSDDSSYLQPVLPEEMKPKFVKGLKRYGRRSRPERPDPGPDSDQNPDLDHGRDGSKLLRATSLDSIESLKSDEEPPRGEQVQQVEEVEGAVTECEHGGALCSPELCWRLRSLDADVQGRVRLREVHRVLCSPLTSTPARTSQVRSGALSEERSFLCTSANQGGGSSPSPLCPGGAEECRFGPAPSSLLTVGQRLLSALDDGSGAASPEHVLSLWREEGLQESQQVLQMLDFSLDERLSLSDLTVALENELLVSTNSVHQAALICYRTELHHLQTMLEQASRERDKAKADLDQSDLRNLQLIRESEERQNSVENSAENRVRDVELACRGRLTSLRTQMEQEMELMMQQTEREKSVLQEQMKELTTRESDQQEALCALRQENVSLEQELSSVRLSLADAQSSVDKLHQDLDRLLLDKFSLDPSGTALSHEERFSEIIREYELQYRELRDRNDELSSELELVKSQRPERRHNRELNQDLRPDLTPDLRAQNREVHVDQTQEQEQTSDYDEGEVKSSPQLRRKLIPLNKTALVSLDSGVDSVSIQTELALEQLREKHQEEIHQLQVKLETQVNYYERNLEQMRSSMELERKDISQAFKMEICELEEQKSDLETQLKQLKENMEKNQQKQVEQRSREQEKRLQRERAEMEQNFAREISNLVQRLSAEKDQLEAELRLKMDQELLLVRSDAKQRADQEEETQLLRKSLLTSECSLEQVTAQLHQSKTSSEMLQKLQTKMEEEIIELQKQCSTSEISLNQSREELARLQQLLCQTQHSCERAHEYGERLEEEVCSWSVRCSELEARLEEACAQLKESIAFLESHEVLNRRLTEEKVLAEAELQRLLEERRRHPTEEDLMEEVQTLRRDRERLIQDLKEQAMNVDTLRLELDEERGKEEERKRDEERRSREAESTREDERRSREQDRSRISELEMRVDQLNMEVVERKDQEIKFIEILQEEQRRNQELLVSLEKITHEQKHEEETQEQMVLSMEKLSNTLEFQKSRVSELEAELEAQAESINHLSAEKSTYMRLCDQLSAQIVEMEEETRALRELLGEVSARLNTTADLVLELRAERSERQAEAQRVREERDRLKKESDRLKEEKDRLKEQRDRLNKEKEKLKEEGNRLKEENDLLKEERDRLKKERDQLKEERDQLKEEKERLKEERGQLKEENDLLKEERDQTEKKTQRLMIEVVENAQLKEERDHLKEENGLLKEEKDKTETEMQRLTAEVAESTRLKAQSEQKHCEELQQLRAESEERLDHMEALVRRLEQDDRDTFRTQMEEVRSENGALQERLTLLQQEVAALEEDVATKRRKLEETQHERERDRDEQEALRRENADLRGQILDLSRRNLELSDTNADLSAKIRGDQENLVMIRERLKNVNQEQEEHSASVQRLKEELVQTERDKQQRLNSLNQEKHLLQTELTAARAKVGRVSELESELQSLGLKLQWSEDDSERLRRDAETRRRQVEDLGESLKTLEIEADSLRAQLQSTNQEALSHKQEVMQAQGRLQEAHHKVEELESSLRKFMTEKEEVTSSLEAELQQLRVKNQELDHKVHEVQAENLQIQNLNQQQLDLRTQLDQLETAKTKAQDQALRADTALSLVQAQHLRQIHQIQESRSESRSRDELDSALVQLRDERQKRERLEQQLRERDTSVTQGQYEKAVSVLQQRAEDLETQLKATRGLLQEKVTELQDQVSRSVHSGTLLQQLYLENSELQGALQVTEQRHRQAQKKSQVLESKVQALNRVLRQLVPHALA